MQVLGLKPETGARKQVGRRRYHLMVRICGSHPQNPGSIPGSATKQRTPEFWCSLFGSNYGELRGFRPP